MQDVVSTATHGYLWTMTAGSADRDNVFYVISGGGVRNNNAYNSTPGVAPVLYLSSDITLSGSGTDIDPYEIVS